jgi:hypothetical protein
MVVKSDCPLATPVLFLMLALYFPIASMAVINAHAEAKPLFPVPSPPPLSVNNVNVPSALEADAQTFASHPAVPVTSAVSMERAGKDRKSLSPLQVNETTSGTFPIIGEPAQELSERWPIPKDDPPESTAKPARCNNDYIDGMNPPLANPCRVYIYRNTAGTQVGIYTGWFVDATHVVTTGMAVASGGVGKYNVFAVKGRYGAVCCDPAGLTPDSCPASSSYNIIRAVTTSSWLNKGSISNAGAVLKIAGPTTTPAIIPYQQTDCPAVPDLWDSQYI